jgi:hypothetical protein
VRELSEMLPDASKSAIKYVLTEMINTGELERRSHGRSVTYRSVG